MAFVATLLGSMSATANTLRLQFSGTTDYANSYGYPDSEQNAFAAFPLFAAGTPFSGHVDIYYSTPDSISSPEFGRYDGAITSYTLTIATTTVALDAAGALENTVSVADDYVLLFTPPVTTDWLQPYLVDTEALTLPSAPAGATWTSQINLRTSDSTFLTSDQLPTTIPGNLVFDSMSSINLRGALGIPFIDEQASEWYWEGTIESVSLTPVPLPAAAWLFLSALGGLAVIGRRRRLFARS